MFNRLCIVFFWRNISYIWYINIWYSNICIQYIYIHIKILYLIHHTFNTSYRNYNLYNPRAFIPWKKKHLSVPQRCCFASIPGRLQELGPSDTPETYNRFLGGKMSKWQKMRILHPRNLTACPWKMMVGRWVSFWDCLFLGAMLNFRGVVGWLVEQNFLGHF